MAEFKEFKFNLLSRQELIEWRWWEEIKEYLDTKINENKFLYWPAWSWKTSIIITYLFDLVKNNPNAKILFLVYGNFLRYYIRQTIGNIWNNYKIESYESYKNDLNIKNNNFKEAILNYSKKNWKIDYLIIDEAQDIDIEFIKNSKELANHIFIMWDNSQTIYEKRFDDNIDWSEQIIEYLDIKKPFDKPLKWIRRYPEKIYNFAIQFFPNEYNNKPISKPYFKYFNQEWFDHVVIYKEENENNEISRIIQLINRIQSEDSWKNIWIIVDLQSKAKYIYDKIKEQWIECTMYTNELNYNIETYYSPFVTTISSSKWTDADYIILPNIKAPESYCTEWKNYEYNCVNNNFLNPEHLYVACTRAKKQLIITCHWENLLLEKIIFNWFKRWQNKDKGLNKWEIEKFNTNTYVIKNNLVI